MNKPPAPKKGDPASEDAIAQTFLDGDYQLCDSYDLARIMLENWDVRWKESPAPVTNGERNDGV